MAEVVCQGSHGELEEHWLGRCQLTPVIGPSEEGMMLEKPEDCVLPGCVEVGRRLATARGRHPQSLVSVRRLATERRQNLLVSAAVVGSPLAILPAETLATEEPHLAFAEDWH